MAKPLTSLAVVSLLAWGPFAATAPVPKRLKTTDPTAIVGTWNLVSATYCGQPFESAHGTKWELSADGTAVRDRPNQGVGKAKYTLDPAVTPKQFNWDTEEGNLFLGAYELDRDTLKISLRLDSNGRPTSAADTTNAYVFEFHRAGGKK